jgi:bacterioferritin (cytochrome b1)
MRSHAEPKKAPEAEQKHVAKGEIAEMSHADQLAEILQIIGRQPEGVSAAQIAGAVGLSALQVGRLATELADSGKVRKDETTRRYFP